MVIDHLSAYVVVAPAFPRTTQQRSGHWGLLSEAQPPTSSPQQWPHAPRTHGQGRTAGMLAKGFQTAATEFCRTTEIIAWITAGPVVVADLTEPCLSHVLLSHTGCLCAQSGHSLAVYRFTRDSYPSGMVMP